MAPFPRSMMVIAGLALFAAGPIFAQAEGPLAPPPKFEVKRLPAIPTPGPPPIPLPQLVQQVAKNEDAILQAYFAYTFEQTITVQELPGPEGGEPGEFSITGEVSRKPDGQRFERVSKPAVSTLKRAYPVRFEVDKFTSIPLFILTSSQIPNYKVTFEGDETLDEIHAYILRVQPRLMERTTRRFDGVVWVDDHDMAIVKSYGRFVGDVARSETLEDPFQQFEIYRENIAGHLWFPTYVDSDSVIPLKDGDLRLRLVMRSSNFRLTAQSAPSPTPASGAPPSLPAPIPQSAPAKP